MTTSPTPSAGTSRSNEEQIEYWNGKAGQTWVRSMDRIDRMMAPIQAALVELVP